MVVALAEWPESDDGACAAPTTTAIKPYTNFYRVKEPDQEREREPDE